MMSHRPKLLALATCGFLAFTSAHTAPGDRPEDHSAEGYVVRHPSKTMEPSPTYVPDSDEEQGAPQDWSLPATPLSDLDLAEILLSLGSFKGTAVAGHKPMAGEASGKRESNIQGGRTNPKAPRQGYDDGAAISGPTAAPAIAADAVPASFEQIKHKAGSFRETSEGVANRFKLIIGEISQAHQKIQRIEQEIISEHADLRTHIEIYKKMYKHSRDLIKLFRDCFVKQIKDKCDQIAPVHMAKLIRSPEINRLFTREAYQEVFDTIQTGNQKLTLSGKRVSFFAKSRGIILSFK